MNRVEIPLSKKKMVLLLICALGFIIIGYFFIINPERFLSPIARNPDNIRIAGIAAVIFFGAVSIYGSMKIFDKQSGLIIDKDGILDNTNASSVGLIKWSDILEIKIEQVDSIKFFLIYTSNPNDYLDRAKGFRKKLMQGNNNMYGTPLSITANTLKYNFSDLENLLKENLDRSRDKKIHTT